MSPKQAAAPVDVTPERSAEYKLDNAARRLEKSAHKKFQVALQRDGGGEAGHMFFGLRYKFVAQRGVLILHAC